MPLMENLRVINVIVLWHFSTKQNKQTKILRKFKPVQKKSKLAKSTKTFGIIEKNCTIVSWNKRGGVIGELPGLKLKLGSGKNSVRGRDKASDSKKKIQNP